MFARHFSNDGPFECNVLDPLYNRKANPRRIINHRQMLYPEYEPQVLMEEALKVKYALELIVTISSIYNAVYVSQTLMLLFPTINSRIQELFKVVQTIEGQLSGRIIQWLTTRKNRRAEKCCKFKRKILALVWGSLKFWPILPALSFKARSLRRIEPLTILFRDDSAES